MTLWFQRIYPSSKSHAFVPVGLAWDALCGAIRGESATNLMPGDALRCSWCVRLARRLKGRE